MGDGALKPFVLKTRYWKAGLDHFGVDIWGILLYCDFSSEHWLHIRTSNRLNRLNREICRRSRAVGSFPDSNSALMPALTRLRYVDIIRWSNMNEYEAYGSSP